MSKTAKGKKKNKIGVINMLGLALGVPLFAYAVILVPPGVLVQDARIALSATAVGATASVPPNPDNTLAQELDQKAATLDQREQQMTQLEAATAARDAHTNMIAFASLGASMVLFALVGLNFYLDTKRRRDQRAAPGTFSVDLRRMG